MSASNSRQNVIISALAVIAVVVGWACLHPSKPPAANFPQPPVANSALDQKLQSAPAALAAAEDKIKFLAALRAYLTNLPPAEASTAIRRFLDSKTDARTGLDFKIGKHGQLTAAPTLRVFLLNCLGELDPAAAATYSRGILENKSSPDEWAVALQNIALSDPHPEARALLQQKFQDMLQDPQWQANPSTGYLEAFDVAVYLGGTNLVPQLSELVRKTDNQAVSHASFLALDRMVINDPANLLGSLEANPDLLAGREQTRADYFGRADVRDPGQRQVLESYLLNPNLSPTELDAFVGIFPNANFMVSDNLLTPSPAPDHADLVARDAASLQTVQQWLADPRFQNIRPQLGKLQSKLSVFVNQAQAR